MVLKKFVLLLVALFFLFGCTQVSVDDNSFDFDFNTDFNSNLNSVNKSQVVSDGLDDVILFDCGDSLDCLINAVRDEKPAKAIIESVQKIGNYEIKNTDYLEIIIKSNLFILYRNMVIGDLKNDGTCDFEKQELISFLEKWNYNSFETDYYETFFCKGKIYTVRGVE